MITTAPPDIDTLPWECLAACRRTQIGLFYPATFPERPEDRDSRERHAKQICGKCPVRTECLDYALEHHELFGIRGGLTETERRGLLAISTNTTYYTVQVREIHARV